MGDRLLMSLVRAGRKASKIAQICRAEEELFSILVQEKGKLQNDKLDFKTLADVFIQEVAKSEILSQCPEISKRVYGEEKNQFTNTLGETITVEVKDTEVETTKLLSKVLDGNVEAAKLFAKTAHTQEEGIKLNEVEKSKLSSCHIDLQQLGVWIDPIDATSQYVKGSPEKNQLTRGNIYTVGLQCVTVLIGVFNIITGLPVMGVIFQPFHKKTQSSWESKCYWGFCHNDVVLNNVESIYQENKESRSTDNQLVILISPADQNMRTLLKEESKVTLCTASGAGYKCLCVIQGLVDAFACSSDSCYRWDTCAAHALLLSLGGGIVSLKHVAQVDKIGSSTPQLLYNNRNPPQFPPWAHVGGFVAYSNSKKSTQCLEVLGQIKQLSNPIPSTF